MSTRLEDVAQTALAAINAVVQNDADDFVSGVTRNFRARARRPRIRSRDPGVKRGPRFGSVWKCHLFLLSKHNDDFVPSVSEQARLTRNGMGVPTNEQPGNFERFKKRTLLSSHLDLAGLEDFVVQLYPSVPQLARVGFTFVKSTKLRRLVPVTGSTVEELRVELRRSQLFILPKRDLFITDQQPLSPPATDAHSLPLTHTVSTTHAAASDDEQPYSPLAIDALSEPSTVATDNTVSPSRTAASVGSLPSDMSCLDLGTPTVQINRRLLLIDSPRRQQSPNVQPVTENTGHPLVLPDLTMTVDEISDTPANEEPQSYPVWLPVHAARDASTPSASAVWDFLECEYEEYEYVSRLQSADRSLPRHSSDTAESALKTLSQKVLDRSSEARLNLTVRRKFALHDGIEMLELASAMDLFRPLRVNFVGESSVDDGGPTREFASLMVMQCQTSSLMEGSRLSCRNTNLQTADYLQLGRLVSITLLQGGPGLPVFDSATAEYILSGQVTQPALDEFPAEVQPLIAQLKSIVRTFIEANRVSANDADDIIQQYSEFIQGSVSQLVSLTDMSLIDELLPDRAKYGSTRVSSACTSDDIRMLVQSIWLRECLGQWHAALAQFVEGLNLGGVLTTLKVEGVEKCRHLFDRDACPAVSAWYLHELSNVQFAHPVGSNKRMAEEAAARSWFYFLRATEAGRAKESVNGEETTLSTSDILMWLTGARFKPATGFAFAIKIYFLEDIRLPHVSTCGLYCSVPVSAVQDARRSVSTFTKWIFDSPGFGLV